MLEKQPILASEWVSPSSYYYHQLEFDKNKITIKKDPQDNSSGYATIFSSRVLSENFSFTLKIHANYVIGFGIAESEEESKEYLDEIEKNRLAYDSEGELYQAGIEVEKPPEIEEEDYFVHVYGDLNEGWVCWEIDEEEKCKHFWDNLKNPNVQWVPYIYSWSSDHIIELIE